MKRLVLVGGGHASALVLLRFRDFISKHLEVVLVSPRTTHLYSGMVPGVVAGHYAIADARIDLAALCRQAGAELILGSVASLPHGSLALHDGGEVTFDVAALNIGSVPGFGGVPGAAQHAVPARPFEPFLEWWDKVRALKPRVAVVGAGAGGVELAMALKHGGACDVVLYSEKNSFSPAVGERIARALKRLGVALRGNTLVTAVEAGPRVVSASGSDRFDAVVWSAGPAAPPLARESGLKTDAAGYALTDRTLRSVSRPEVFAVGDCASIDGLSVPKSGVYAVREGEVLAENLKHLALGQPLRDFVPQAKSLYLISCGEKYAIASRGAWSAEGAWAWRWKNWIDRRWIALFR